MFEIDLGPEREQQLRDVATSRQQELSQLVREVLERFLDDLNWPEDSESDLAEASVSMASEVLPQEDWTSELP